MFSSITVQHPKPVLIGKYPRFAGALYDLAGKQKNKKSLNDNLSQTGSSLEVLEWAITSGRWADMVEEAGAKTVEEKVATMEEYVESMGLDDIAGSLVTELIREDELKAFKVISQTYLEIFRYKNNVYDALILSANPLTAKQVTAVKARVTALCPEKSDINFSLEV